MLFGLFESKPSETSREAPPLLLYNTLGREVQEFTPPELRPVKMYNCGPTVYGPQHIGNLSMYVFTDILRKTLEYNGMEVKQVINFTDVGHLSGDNEGDADTGEDKMTKGLRREGLAPTLENMRLLGEKYAQEFLSQLQKLGIDTDSITFPRASDYIPAQIAMIETLVDRGYAYKIEDGIYFDTAAYPEYGALGNIDLSSLREGARVSANTAKRNPTDFALWKFNPEIGWDSPWGKGFPGWHIECSAMIRDILGPQIDIHTGGIEHIPVHHNNEIAQSEAALGVKPLSRFWMHRAHVQIEGAKIAKSDGNTVYLSDIEARGIDPLAFRYFLLGAHYRTPANFTWAALEAAEQAFMRLHHARNRMNMVEPGSVIAEYQQIFHERINDDLDTPGALAVVWELVKDATHPREDVLATLADFDRVLGLNLASPDIRIAERLQKEYGAYIEMDDVPQDVQEMVAAREAARLAKNWPQADTLRAQIENLGFIVEDAPHGPKLLKK